MRMRITVIVTDQEYAEIKRRAGLIPLSTWLKSIALHGIEIGELKSAQEQAITNIKSFASRKKTEMEEATEAVGKIPAVRAAAKKLGYAVPDEPVLETESGPTTGVSNGSEQETASTAPDFIESTVARRVGHVSGCTCYACARFRKYLKESQKPRKEPEEKKVRR
jgi:hypothetical protein